MVKLIILDYYLFYFLYLSIVRLRSYCSHEWGWIRDTVSIFLKLEFILIELISNHYIQILTNSIRVWRVRNNVREYIANLISMFLHPNSFQIYWNVCMVRRIHVKYNYSCIFAITRIYFFMHFWPYLWVLRKLNTTFALWNYWSLQSRKLVHGDCPLSLTQCVEPFFFIFFPSRNCPIDLKEAISSVIFTPPRC